MMAVKKPKGLILGSEEITTREETFELDFKVAGRTVTDGEGLSLCVAENQAGAELIAFALNLLGEDAEEEDDEDY